MGTSAKWVLWVGARMNRSDYAETTEVAGEILDQLRGGGIYSVDGVDLEIVCMHGRGVGVGVVVHALPWTDVLGEQNFFDAKLLEKALALVPEVDKIFKSMDLAKIAQVQHHIDLGG